MELSDVLKWVFWLGVFGGFAAIVWTVMYEMR